MNQTDIFWIDPSDYDSGEVDDSESNDLHAFFYKHQQLWDELSWYLDFWKF